MQERMDSGSIKNIKNYVEKVVADAMVSEGREGVTMAQFAVVGDRVILYFSTRYIRVSRKIIYRIVKNARENLGCDIEIATDMYWNMRENMEKARFLAEAALGESNTELVGPPDEFCWLKCRRVRPEDRGVPKDAARIRLLNKDVVIFDKKGTYVTAEEIGEIRISPKLFISTRLGTQTDFARKADAYDGEHA